MYIECRHIFPSGKKCQSPALTEKDFCYFHHNKRNQKTPSRKSGEPSTLVHHLPQLEDVDTILTALSDVIQALGANRIDPRRAQILIYGLQVASQHSKRLSHHASIEPVREAYEDEDGTLVGPRLQAYDTEDVTLDDEEEEDEEITEEDRRAYFGIRACAMPEEEAQDSQDSPETQETSQPGAPEPANHLPRIHAVADSSNHHEKGWEESLPKRTAKKRCRTFPQSNEAPLLPPDPLLKPGQLRAYAQKQIIKTFYCKGTQGIPKAKQVSAGI
jgi:hypothetical protein